VHHDISSSSLLFLPAPMLGRDEQQWVTYQPDAPRLFSSIFYLNFFCMVMLVFHFVLSFFHFSSTISVTLFQFDLMKLHSRLFAWYFKKII
jgi:hypothetical protein